METSGLREGDRLPAESRLAAQFEVSRMTLRSALDVLEREGLVRREKNCGCVCAIPSSPKRGLMARTLVLLSDHRPASDAKIYGGSSASVVSGVIDGANQRRMNFLRIHPDIDTDTSLNELVSDPPAGVVMSCWERPIDWQLKLLHRLKGAGVPVVAWGEHATLTDFDRVISNHVSGTEQLVHALAKQGKRRILRLWTQPPETANWIAAHDVGYDRATAALGLPSLPAVRVDALAEREPITQARFNMRVRLFAGYLAEHLNGAQPVDAIMVGTDCEVFLAMAACKLFGRSDVAVTGYDNYWQMAPERQWEPGVPFATVDKGNHRMGEEMVELLSQRITKALPAAPQERLIDQQVILMQPSHAAASS